MQKYPFPIQNTRHFPQFSEGNIFEKKSFLKTQNLYFFVKHWYLLPFSNRIVYFTQSIQFYLVLGESINKSYKTVLGYLDIVAHFITHFRDVFSKCHIFCEENLPNKYLKVAKPVVDIYKYSRI